MGLECCAYFPDFDYYANPDDDFSKAPEDCKCTSCNKEIKKGDVVLHFTCYKSPDENSDNPDEIKAWEDGDYFALPDEFHCERCGEIYLNLNVLGYCLSSGDYMPECLKEYQEMTGFSPEKYKK